MTGQAIPGAAQYLLRFDDLCPTMAKAQWRAIVPMFERHAIRPILAVIPDNQDPEFLAEPADPEFWQQMRQLEKAGATIGLHGYQHLCTSVGRSLVPLHRQSEFAGAPRDFQCEWIRRGVNILREQGLRPTVWVAPRHGFDRITLHALREEGLEVISDGFATRPYRSLGMTWIPQQLWAPVARDSGLWTVCLHTAQLSDRSVRELELFLDQHAAQFTSVERVMEEWPAKSRSIGDRLFHARAITRLRLSRLRRMRRS